MSPKCPICGGLFGHHGTIRVNGEQKPCPEAEVKT